LIRILALTAVLGIAACGDDLPEVPPQQLPGSPFHYPEDLWDEGVQGETLLRLFVTETGGVDSVQVERTSGYESFDTAAVRGARDLRFEPARRGVDSIAAWVLLPVQFDLPAANQNQDAGEGGP
jgi:TonB family protein